MKKLMFLLAAVLFINIAAHAQNAPAANTKTNNVTAVTPNDGITQQTSSTTASTNTKVTCPKGQCTKGSACCQKGSASAQSCNGKKCTGKCPGKGTATTTNNNTGVATNKAPVTPKK